MRGRSSFSGAAIALAVAVAALAGCGGQEHDPRPTPGSWFAEIEAVGEHGHSGFGIVTLLADGGTRANVTLTGGSAGGVHPWHVHDGTCEEEGPIVGNAEAYPLLRPDASGNASATLALPVTLSRDEPYSIHIHQSSDDMTIAGCGELVTN